MGCWGSKAEESSVVDLCRERVELIRSARDRRYALATAHAAYFRALAAVGDALQRFVQEELEPGSPVIVLPSSEAKGKPRTGRDGAVAAAAAASNSSSATPLSHSLSPEGSHLMLSSGSESPRGGRGEGGETRDKVDRSGAGADLEDFASPRQSFWSSSPNTSFMSPSTAIPTMIYEDPFAPAWSNFSYNGYGYAVEHPHYGVPIGSPLRGREDIVDPSVAPGTPPPPPPVEASSWDFIDPFSSYEEFLHGYSGGMYGVRSSVSSSDLSDLRRREGIPDLEEEAEVVPVKVVKTEKMRDDDDLRMNPTVKSSHSGSTENAQVDGNIGLAEKGRRSSSAGGKVKSSEDEDGSSGKKKGVTFEDRSYVTEESGPGGEKSLSGHSEVQPLVVRRPRDVMEVVKEIKELFMVAAGCGEEVSRLLELDKLPYQSRSRTYRVFLCRIFNPTALPFLICSHPSKWQTSSESKRRMTSNTSNHTAATSGNLSSTLEKLYLWEKKLFREVKDEEKLRISYDKKYKWLKDLDGGGAENSKIDLTWASLRELSTKISIIIKSVDSIAGKVHKIRDEELQPQLIELIQGFIGMWKILLDCHQKQLQALADCKSHILAMRNTRPENSPVKVAKELELELVNWCNSFNDWMHMQKSYIEALNGWLLKWLPQEQELTVDGLAPFSPSRIGAPSVFIISNDWHHAMKYISSEKVIEKMHAFKETVRMTRESQEEERHLRLEEEHLSRVYNMRLKSMQVTQTNGHLDIVSASGNDLEYHDDSLMAIRKRVNERREKHKETLEKLQKVASDILRTALLPAFEELGTSTSESLQAYNGIRIKTDSLRT